MTLSEIFEYKRELDATLAKINLKSVFYFTIVAESKDTYSKKRDFCENEYQVKELMSNVVDWYDDLYNEFSNMQLDVNFDKFDYKSFRDKTHTDYIIMYLVDVKFESRD